MPLQLRQILERVGAAQLAGVDQAHQHVAHLSAVQRLVKQCILAMQHSTLQRPFTDVVIQRGPGLAQKRRQALPVPQQGSVATALNGAAVWRVGSVSLLVETEQTAEYPSLPM